MSQGYAELALNGGRPVAPQPVHPVWPRLTSAIEARLIAQARRSLSIYDRSDVVQDFEDAFAGYVGMPLALATSSGTAALHSMYYGANIGPGDEVICADYGFFATVTPLVLLGAQPVFVDCTMDGTISPERAAAAITARTKAIVVTHMWGQPAKLDALQSLCSQQKLLLFEDCSHAHGARFNGAIVGSFGHSAIWSLQANKAIWAGEGGVLATRDKELHERALLLGHFNLRALQEIPNSSPNYQFAFTGTGLKYRPHPLGLAMAMPQIEIIDQLIEGRQKSAAVLMNALSSIPGVQLLVRLESGMAHGFYSLVALINPALCGFDREIFLQALQAENIYVANVPRQMGSMSHFPFFGDGGSSTRSQESETRLENSRYITSTAIKFFVPSMAADLSAETDVSVVADSICKVGEALARHA